MIMSIVIFISGAIYLTGTSLFQVQKNRKHLLRKNFIGKPVLVPTSTLANVLTKQKFGAVYLSSLCCISVPEH